MRLIIAEKKSVATAISQALGTDAARGDGYLRAGNDTIVTWAQGHLIDLATPAEYPDRDWAKWSLDTLPMDPGAHWEWKVSEDKGAARQYRIVDRLLHDEDVTMVVNACDPDREGEAIFHRIIRYSHVRKPMRRLWVASLEPEAILQALKDMRDETEYRGLAAAADIRAKADWLVGMNASRAYSLTYGRRFPVGRVQTPTLALVTERDRTIAAHRPTPFWTVTADMGGWTLTSERLDNQERARSLRESVLSEVIEITKAERKRAADRPPHLYDLTGLQKDMSRLHGMTAARTLAALQHLYELKLASYPRTDSRWITHEDLPNLIRLIDGERLATGFIDPAARPAKPRPELTVNDGKVAGHTAILPTLRVDAAALDPLTEDERRVLTRIVRRTWEAVGADRIHDVAKVEARCAGVTFTARSDRTITPGWTMIEHDRPEPDPDDDRDRDAGVIPVNLVAGVRLHPVGDVRIDEGHTAPPKPYTDATLLAAMEHAGRLLDDPDLRHAIEDDATHSGGLGTPATRADIIERLVKSGYIERRNRTLRSTQDSRDLIRVVAPTLKDVALTARMEQRLADVEHGQAEPDKVMDEFASLARNIPSEAVEHEQAGISQAPRENRETFGPCPRCGKPVVRTGRIWQCSTNRSRKDGDDWELVEGCGWKLFGVVGGRKLTDANVRTLLGKGRVTLKGFTSRNGKPFDAALVPDTDHGCRFDFNDHRRNGK